MSQELSFWPEVHLKSRMHGTGRGRTPLHPPQLEHLSSRHLSTTRNPWRPQHKLRRLALRYLGVFNRVCRLLAFERYLARLLAGVKPASTQSALAKSELTAAFQGTPLEPPFACQHLLLDRSFVTPVHLAAAS